MQQRNTILSLTAILALGTPACLNVGVYRTARTLPEGEGDFSMTWSYVRAKIGKREVTTEVNGQEIVVDEQPAAIFTYPNLVPELAYHHGVTDDLELGGRLALAAGLAELDAKYRFIGSQESEFHLAVQPAGGYRALGFIEGFSASLPLIATYDLSDGISINAAGFGMFTSFDTSIEDAEDNVDFSGKSIIAGGSGGIQFRTSGGFHLMPSVEYQHSLSRSGDAQSLPNINSLLVGLTLGWGPGRNEAQ